MKRSNVCLKVLVFIFLVSFSLLSVGCKGETGAAGPTGPAGPAGPTGPPGITLIKTYTGTIANVNSIFSIPEILGKEGKTFVLCYWAFASAPTAWIPATDGWLDNTAIAHIFAVSWATGQVQLIGFTIGDKYRIDVYQSASKKYLI